MKSILFAVMAMLSLTGISAGQGPLPNAPMAEVSSTSAPFGIETSRPAPAARFAEVSPKTVDMKFISLALISSGSTFADSYTTLFARQNWLAGKAGVCNMEVQSAYLYGAHPTVERAYAVAAAKSTVSIFASYYLRKHHNKFWSAPLVANSVISLEGVTQNIIECN